MVMESNDQVRIQGYASSLVEPPLQVQFVDQNQMQMNSQLAASVGPGNMSAMSSSM